MMQILINSNNEIISFAVVGGFEDGIEVDNIPDNFIVNFKPRYYLYNEGQIEVNKNYKKESETFPTDEPHSSDNATTDNELRKTYGNLQMSSVQTAKMVMDLSRQVAALTKQNVELQKEINNKGVE